MSRTALSLIAVFCLSLCAAAGAARQESSPFGKSPVPAGNPARFPETAEGRRLSAFLAAARIGTEAAVREFIEKNFSPAALKETPVEPRLRRILGLVSRLGPFELVRALPPGPDRAGAIVISKKDGKRYELSLELEGAPARGVLGVDFDEAAAGGEDDAPKKTDAELVSAVDGWVTSLAAEGSFSGVVLLARGGKPFFQKAWGQADRGFASANLVDTKFNVGSIGKAFTRAAVIDLVRAGRLSLDDTVAKHLPAARIPSSDRMTIRQLLDMSSGLGDIFGEKYDVTPREHLRTLEDFLHLFEGEPLRFEPGQGKSYSNAGYVVLGLIIEKIAARPYWDFVKDRVFTPAGMTNTGPFGPDEVVANRAIGYTKSENGEWRSNLYALPGRASSAGGVYSTAGDLLRFVGSASSGQGRLGIAGGTAGANAVLESPGPAGVTVIVLANLDPPCAERVAARVRGWARGL
jgi:CubicO group peptidase (beta-lactamase class C family)